jgi:benzoyl-CoA reductase/2-hydroxyglutaryl-CoA dehydratase subunit BcrC/BadD/HgdB
MSVATPGNARIYVITVSFRTLVILQMVNEAHVDGIVDYVNGYGHFCMFSVNDKKNCIHVMSLI